jgi:hypothetical protein
MQTSQNCNPIPPNSVIPPNAPQQQSANWLAQTKYCIMQCTSGWCSSWMIELQCGLHREWQAHRNHAEPGSNDASSRIADVEFVN